MKRAFPAVGGMLAAVVVLVGGCGGAGAPKGPAAPVPAARPQPLTDAERLRIADAEQVLLRQCMSAHGFPYWEAARPSLEKSRTNGYVSDDVNWARTYGYGSRITAEEDRARIASPNITYHKGLSVQRSVAYDKALDGGLDAPVISAELPTGGTVRKHEGGCEAEAEKKLYGDPQAWFRADKTASNLQPLYVPQVKSDPAFTTALTAWSRCMGTAGHPFADPEAARTAAAQQALKTAPDKAFAAERELAVADATCARDTSLKTIGKERETHYINALPARYGAALDTSRRIQHQALARAVTLVGPRR